MKKIITFLTLSVMLIGCKTDTLLPDFIYEMTLSQEALNIEAAGSSHEIELKSNYMWTAVSDQSWCSLQNASGEKGTYKITLTAEKNVKIEERTAYVTVTAGSVIRKIKVVQMNPNGFEIEELQANVTVPGLENVIVLQVRTNMLLEATSADDWIVSLTNDVVAGNPPKPATFRILVKDNTTASERTTSVNVNGVGLSASNAKTFTVTQSVAPAASTTDPRVVGTWIATKVQNNGVTDLSLLGTIMELSADGTYRETLPGGTVKNGTWNIREDRVALYYGGNLRRYIHIEDAVADRMEGTMTSDDINSATTYAVSLQPNSGAAFSVSLLDLQNNVCNYMILINGGTEGATERGICISKSQNPTTASKKYPSSSAGSVLVGELKGIASGETYYIRGYIVQGGNTVYSEEVVLNAPITDVNGNVYSMVKIGTQVWMGENLKATKYRDGTPIPYGKTSGDWGANSSTEAGVYCWVNALEPDEVWTADTRNQIADKTARNYGAIYCGYVPYNKKGICPLGWHLPDRTETIAFITGLGGDGTVSGSSASFRDAILVPNTVYPTSNNSTGFGGLITGSRNASGNGWYAQDNVAGWWSGVFTTPSLDQGHDYPIVIYIRKGAEAGFTVSVQNDGMSIRCLRDAETVL